MYKPIKTCGDEFWNDYTFVLPCVGVGNVGQLAVDVLINSLSMDHVGSMYHNSLLPVVGNNPFHDTGRNSPHCDIVTSIEVYENVDLKIVTLQQRVPFVKGRRASFISALLEWVKSCNFKEIILLSSSHSHERRDQQMRGSQLRYKLNTNAQKLYQETLQELKWIELEDRVSLSVANANNPLADTPTRVIEEGKPEDSAELFLPGSGPAVKMFELCSSSNIPAVVLSLFCAEGDNGHDGIMLASYLNQWKQWKKLRTDPPSASGGWAVPISWKLQYGSTFDQILYR